VPDAPPQSVSPETAPVPAPAAAAAPPAAPRRRSRRPLLVSLALAAILLAADLARPPEAQLSARAALAALAVYQATLSPLLGGAGVRCRFRPTCSHYAVAAVRQDGALVGSLRAVGRVMRCGPWTPAGTVDPP
jgi:putative membrane protein insertion efficiency factor